MQREPACSLCGGRLVRESNVSVAPALPLFFSLAWVCTQCSAASPMALGKRNFRVPSEPLYQGGKRIGGRSGPEPGEGEGGPMGGAGSGARADPARGRRVVELRRQGRTLAQIGHRLHMSRPLVHYYAAAAGLTGPRRGTVHCCECQAVIATGHHTIEYNRDPLCLACLEKRPDVPFGRRLKACRLARGLTADRLATLAGVPARAVRAWERGECWPRWERLAKLIRVLGAELVTLGVVGGAAKGRPAE